MPTETDLEIAYARADWLLGHERRKAERGIAAWRAREATRVAAERAARWAAAEPERRAAASRAANMRRARVRGAGTFARTSRDRRRQLARQRWRCFYCDRCLRPGIETHEEHVVPISRGGRDSIGNIVYACRSCNSSKQARTIMEWRTGRRPA